MDKTPPAQSGTPAASGSASTGRTARDTATGGIRRENWVMQQPADSYTLQIGSVTREQAMVDFIHDKGLESDTAYIELVIDGITRYNGLYGKFNTYAQAEQAAARIAPTIGQQPWIRNFGILQKMLGDE
jgi:septal ring-binding cell division protein DamX